jgi:hypothetical protein
MGVRTTGAAGSPFDVPARDDDDDARVDARASRDARKIASRARRRAHRSSARASIAADSAAVRFFTFSRKVSRHSRARDDGRAAAGTMRTGGTIY